MAIFFTRDQGSLTARTEIMANAITDPKTTYTNARSLHFMPTLSMENLGRSVKIVRYA